MSNLSKQQIEHVARLARIELGEEEKGKFSRELSEILGYVEKLNKVDTKGAEETSQATDLENVYRDDAATEITQVGKDKNINREKMLKNAPDQKDGYIKTRAVLE